MNPAEITVFLRAQVPLLAALADDRLTQLVAGSRAGMFEAHEAIVRRIGRVPAEEPMAVTAAAASALVCDVSSVVSEYLPYDRPYAPAVRPAQTPFAPGAHCAAKVSICLRTRSTASRSSSGG